MKKIFQLVMIFLTVSGLLSVNAQVTIGSAADPHPGAILDLSPDNNLGLLLPRVSLDAVGAWTHDGGQALGGDKLQATGMVVYNTNNSVIGGNGSGIYVWDGSAWKPVKPVVAVTGVSLDESSLSFTTAFTQTLTATVAPSNAENKNVTWSSSNESVATVSSSGVVTPVGNGTATITVKTVDGNFTAACDVSVAFAVTSITLSPASLNFTTTDAQTLTPTINPSNAANQTLTWTSSNENVVTVLNGVVTPVAGGTATIIATATDNSGISTNCPVTVVLPYYFIQNGAYSGPTTSTLHGEATTMAELGAYGFAVSGNLLVYSQDLPNGTSYSWDNAQTACTVLGDDWRLPNIAELGNLQDNYASYGLAIGGCWSSTEYDDMAAWYWYYALSSTYGISKISLGKVRCVKSLY